LILGAVVALVGRRHSEEAGTPPAPQLLASKALTVVPGIHLLGGLEPAAAYVVETSTGLVLIDTGLQAADVKREMAALGLDWQRVVAIFLTHAHHDHSGGAEELRRATGAKVYAGRADAAVLRAAAPLEALVGTFTLGRQRDADALKPTPTTVDVELSGGEDLAFGEVRFRALATPGHTPGSICFLMERADQRVLFSGDVIICLLDRRPNFDDYAQAPSKLTGPLGTYTARMAPRFGGNAAAFLSTLRQLRTLPAPDLVLPGHPRRDFIPQSPVMSPERWRAILDTGISDVEQLLARFARDGVTFLDGVPKALLPGLYYLGELEQVAVYGLSYQSKFFIVNAPGGPGLTGFLQARLKQLGLEPPPVAGVLLTSATPQETAGLTTLVRKYRCPVVAYPRMWAALKQSRPAGAALVMPEHLATLGWLPLEKTLCLQGEGVESAAYVLRWAGKAVLLSGMVPARTQTPKTPALVNLLNNEDYRESLRALAELQPDLWLPSSPVGFPNANLYDREWLDLIYGQLFPH
jgi:glyoxylase-like metal-dependent hydrolase (beta-lactamase superfamily II)